VDTSQPKVTYRFMIILTLVVGVIGIPLLFLPDFDLISIVLSCATLGGLIGGQASYEQQARQCLQMGYKGAFEWLILVMLAAFAFIASSQWFGFGEGIVDFLNSHWPSLILSMMCVLMGIAGLQNKTVESSA
jgi:C4-dicarboxylate transporter